jgi:hypothetical protein
MDEGRKGKEKRKEKKIRRGYDYQDKPRLRGDIVYAT